MSKINPLFEFFESWKKNTITSIQFNNIVKINLIKFLNEALKRISRFKNSRDDSDEDQWFEDCYVLQLACLAQTAKQLIASGLRHEKFEKIEDDIEPAFYEFKYLCYGGNNWVKVNSANIMKRIQQLSKPNYILWDLNEIKKIYNLPS